MLSCLCFSKDRPLQLEAYIESFRWSMGTEVKLSILYTCENKVFEKAYQTLKKRYSLVSWIVDTAFY